MTKFRFSEAEAEAEGKFYSLSRLWQRVGMGVQNVRSEYAALETFECGVCTVQSARAGETSVSARIDHSMQIHL